MSLQIHFKKVKKEKLLKLRHLTFQQGFEIKYIEILQMNTKVAVE